MLSARRVWAGLLLLVVLCAVSSQSKGPAQRCTRPFDCELNGICVGGACRCHPGWRGETCGELALTPASKNAGYRRVCTKGTNLYDPTDRSQYCDDSPDGGNGLSSWGASIVKGPDQLYHMFVAEMSDHCGLFSWTSQSRVIRATSPTPGGRYTFREVVIPEL